MSASLPILPHHQLFSPQLVDLMTRNLRRWTQKLWRTPEDLRQMASGWIEKKIGSGRLEGIVVSGETRSITLYAWDHLGALVLTPLTDVRDNIVLQEVYGGKNLALGGSSLLLPYDSRLVQRLQLPKVLLINPCVLENFPVPRLSLSIGLVAAYLRKYQRADVRIIDMQMQYDTRYIAAEVARFKPALVGLSISYGQKSVALSILDQIELLRSAGVCDPLIILGNIIPASYPREFIERYERLVVATGEGEITAVELAKHLMGELPLSAVPGLAYSITGKPLQLTPPSSVPMETIPLPALDTAPDLGRYRGALTLELSRGCQWNRCTFCPREHKSSHWKTFATPKIVDQFRSLTALSHQLGIKPHIFLADEEFVGGLNDGAETERLSGLARKLAQANLGMRFDAAARADQVFDPKRDRPWHVARMQMWHLCRQAGLDRLFMGIESGSDTQLKRYGKGLTSHTSINAMRVLSALGIPLRFGFITFDPLMAGLSELKENIAFMERTDAILGPVHVEHYGFDKLLGLLTENDEFAAQHSSGKPIFANVSYMLASLEVLINSTYAQMVRVAEAHSGRKLINDGQPDTNMGRYSVAFLDPLVGDIALSCQKWIDRNFALAYAVKSFYKVGTSSEKGPLMKWMISYRHLSLQLLKTLVYLFDPRPSDTGTLGLPPAVLVQADLWRLRASKREQYRLAQIEECLSVFEEAMAELNTTLESALAGSTLVGTPDGGLAQVLARWRERGGVWRLINEQT